MSIKSVAVSISTADELRGSETELDLVALVCFAGFPDQGATYFYEMARALAASGIEVHAFAVRYPGEPVLASEEGVRVHRIVRVGTNRWITKLKFFGRVLWRIWRREFPIVHAYTTLGAFVLPLLGPRRSRYIHEIQSGAVTPGPVLVRRVDDVLRRQQSRLFDLNATVSPELRDRMFGPGDPQVAIFPAGVNLRVFTGHRDNFRRYQHGLTDEAIVLVYSGVIEANREPEVVIRALARAIQVEPRLHLWMIGKGSSLEAMRVLVAELGMNPHVWLPGYLPYREIPSYLASADGGISWLPDVPYFSSGQPPMKVIEFLGAGLPVIASDIPSHSVLVSHGETGLLCPPTEDGLVQALLTFTRDGDLRSKLRLHTRNSVEAYDWQRLAKDRIIPAYRQLLAGDSRSARKKRYFYKMPFNRAGQQKANYSVRSKE